MGVPGNLFSYGLRRAKAGHGLILESQLTMRPDTGLQRRSLGK
jgi:hypothetical protein